LVNIYTDPKTRKTPCSISLPNEMWAKIDEYIRVKYNGRLSRSAFVEDFIRQTLEEDGKELIQDPGSALSVNTARAYIHRIKDFTATNSKEHTIGNLEALRLDLVEAAAFLEQEIKRSRVPTKSDKKEMALKMALAAHEARVGSDGVVTGSLPPAPAPAPIPPPPNDSKETEEQGKQPEPDPMDLEYEQILKEVYVGYKEPPPPKPDYEIIDEGRTEKNPYDKTKTEEVFK
jgi:hypothetical protein